MFGKRVTLFKLLGFEVRVDASWLILAVLIVWTLARGYFPAEFPWLSNGMLWAMGVAGAIGLFASIVLHEFSHALVARRSGIPMKGITLFIFGGVAEMDDEPPDAGSEFRMAIAGPATSLAIAVVCYAAYWLGGLHIPLFWSGVLQYLAFINVILAVFNMLPAFPLDGGRVLRAFLWSRRKNLRSATHTAARMGSGFGAALIGFGVLSILFGNFIGGLWWFLIGMFLRAASQMSYRQMELKQVLAGEPVSRFLRQAEAVVPPWISAQDLVDHYFYRYYRNVFPVADGPYLMGRVDVRKLKDLPRGDWGTIPVKQFLEPCTNQNTVPPSTGCVEALTRMTRGNHSWLMVATDDRLEGIVTLRDLLNYVVLQLDLDGGPPADFRQLSETSREAEDEPALRR